VEHEDVKVFIGPTLSIANARAFLDAQYLPPASRGDIYRASKLEPRIIVLIDGAFESGAAVLHNEILWALSQGIGVLGAASIGALRAAELEPFGMMGIGEIFEAYRDHSLERDDAVAVVHGPEELGYPLLTIALVDVWATLNRASEERILNTDDRDLLKDIASKIFYKQLGFKALLEAAVQLGFSSDRAIILGEYLATQGGYSQKRADAIEALRAVASESVSLTPATNKSFVFERTSAWQQLAAELDEYEVTTAVNRSNLSSEAELAMIGLALSERDAQRRGFVLDRSEFEDAARRFRGRNNLHKSPEVQRWMEIAQFDNADYVKLIEDEVFIERSRMFMEQCMKHLMTRLNRHRRSTFALLRK
jgi:hypothetical protein